MKKLMGVLLFCALFMGGPKMTANAAEVEKLNIISVKVVDEIQNYQQLFNGSYHDYMSFSTYYYKSKRLCIEFDREIEWLESIMVKGYSDTGNKYYGAYDSNDNWISDTSYNNRSLVNKPLNDNKLYIKIHGRNNVALSEIEVFGKYIKADPTLTLTDVDDVEGIESFSTYVQINNAEDIYAQDLSIEYDNYFMKLENAEIVTTTTNQVIDFYHKEIDEDNARFITVSKGVNNAINTTSSIIRLDFKAKNRSGNGYIRLIKGKVANGKGEEFTVTDDDIYVNFLAKDREDVNQDGIVSLGDLALAGKYYGTDSYYWDVYKPDVNEDYRVDDYDLSKIVTAMLKEDL